VGILIIFIYFYKLGDIPTGFFADEALVGYRAWQVLHGDLSGFINPFFYRHFNYIFGALNVYSNIPFVALFGLSEFSVRLSFVFFALMTIFVIYRILKKLRMAYALPAVFLYAISPVFFHFARVNFVQLPSLFFLMFGYYMSLSRFSLFRLIATGVLYGISMYGYSGFIFITPLFVGLSVISLFLYEGLMVNNMKRIGILSIAVLITVLPIIIGTFTNPQFFQRLNEKNSENTPFYSYEKLKDIRDNYPKYFSYTYLFSKGENGMEGSFITRYSIQGNGIFLKVTLPLLISAFAVFVSDMVSQKNTSLQKYFLPFFMLFFLFPFPDILTTKKGTPPYSVSVFTNTFFLPFIISYAANWYQNIRFAKIFKQILIIGVMIIILLEGISFYRNYLTYPRFSSDFWGWQYGPKPIMKYFLSQKDRYDNLYMTGSFNAPDIFLQFYDPEHTCKKCSIGAIEQFNPMKKQLFAMRKEEVTIELKQIMRVQEIIYYPNGEIAFYIFSLGLHE